MTPEREALLEHLSAMGRELAPETIAGLAADTAAGRDITPPNARVRVLRDRLKNLWSQVEGVSAGELAWALLAAQRAAGDVAKSQTLSLVWTGPDTNVPVRRNDEALYEVIASAERELLVVSFVVFNVPRVHEGLVAAANRGVEVRLVLEFHGAKEDEPPNPAKALGQLPDAVRVLHWPLDKRPQMSNRRGYIHAKCAVADRSIAVVSSANLTLYALEANIELGVLIRGGSVPPRIAEQFAALEADRVLAPFER